MPNLEHPHAEVTQPITSVIAEVTSRVEQLRAGDFMIVGAWCRDLWHNALGHDFATTMTHDLDLAIAVESYESFEAIATNFPPTGHSGIRFEIARYPVDVIPFGDVEDPTGIAQPPTREENVSVWGFREVYSNSTPLSLGNLGEACLPTIPGYAALKLAAWLDRSQWHEFKDAADLGLVLFWYSESGVVQQRLYETPQGQAVLIAANLDIPLAAARLLGLDIAYEIGLDRSGELGARWPTSGGTLARDLVVMGHPTGGPNLERRAELVAALSRGIWADRAL